MFEEIKEIERIVGENNYRNGILWYASWDIRAFPNRGRKPFNISPEFAQRLSNGNTLVCECWDVIEITPELDIVWQFGEWPVNGSDEQHLNTARSAWYYEETGNIIIADTDNNRVLEVNKNSGKVTRRLDNLSKPTSAFLNPDNGNLMISEGDNHYVYEITWSGDIVWEFGEKGVAIL